MLFYVFSIKSNPNLNLYSKTNRKSNLPSNFTLTLNPNSNPNLNAQKRNENARMNNEYSLFFISFWGVAVKDYVASYRSTRRCRRVGNLDYLKSTVRNKWSL